MSKLSKWEFWQQIKEEDDIGWLFLGIFVVFCFFFMLGVVVCYYMIKGCP